MKRWLFILVITIMIATMITPKPTEAALKKHLCPVCDTTGYFTGTTKFDWGHLFELYRCPNNHEWWERVN